ncbi:hypothetical protein LEL_10895 [Akanthomyces lecanii RCEF 1005]|uniref:Uncharacterized protein n=1 Tax=Akanthomyces lecanii RCEF 1005 TaxID=1081108 RepID=A0A167QZJ4_CORDF|nr:hypothetical protein LEL_10895 [Akanthomyces lecanii RCEF 1005]
MSDAVDFLTAEQAKESTLLHFYVVAKFGDEYCPLAAVAQSPPDDTQWMNMQLPFIAGAALEMYQWFGDKSVRCCVRAELDAAKDLLSTGRVNVPGTLGGEPASRLLTPEAKKAMKMDPLPARFPFLANSLRRCVKELPIDRLGMSESAVKHWDIVPLGTVLEYDDIRNAAILIDITDPEKIKMCGVDHVFQDDVVNKTAKIVDTAGTSRMHGDVIFKDGPAVRGTRPVHEWLEERWKKDQGWTEVVAGFPDIPEIPEEVLQMFWTNAPIVTREAPPLTTFEDSEWLLALLKSDTSRGKYVGLVHICDITPDILVATLTDSEIRESVEHLAFGTDVFSGPQDQEGFDKVAKALHNLPRLSKVYVAETPKQFLTAKHREDTKVTQRAFEKRVQHLNNTVWSSTFMDFSCGHATDLQN